MKVIMALSLLFLSASCGFVTYSYAQNELAPGFNQCMEDSMGKMMVRHCYLEAERYWGKKLESVYPRFVAYCNKAGNPEKCKEKIRKMQSSWLQYTKLMSEILFVEGLDETANPNPEIEGYENNGEFLALSTKAQYEWICKIINCR